jgi:hypothetical protein
MELDLGTLQLPATKTASLFGRSAPELQDIKEWKGGVPLTLAELRGKLVLLTFWSPQHGVQYFSRLMALLRACLGLNVVFIVIREGSVDSLAAMEESFQMVVDSAEAIEGKPGSDEPPLWIAMDSDGPEQKIADRSYIAGTNWINYGITIYPRTLLIDQRGIVRREILLTKDVEFGLMQLGPFVSMKKGDPLRSLAEFKIKLSSQNVKEKMILLCFFDMNQRPSRNCMKELSKKVHELKGKEVVVIAIHTSKTEHEKLDDWVKKNNIPFQVGMVQGNEDKTRFTWGVRSLPWLILTDKEHIVTAQGFRLDELDEKITALKEK